MLSTMRISSRRLGEFLVARRVLSRDALDELLAREEAEGVDLSNLLAAGELVGEHDLTAAIAHELGLPFVDVAERSILPDVWGLVPEDLARGYFTWRSRDGVVTVRPLPKLAIGILPVLPGVFETRHEVLLTAKQASRNAMAAPASALYIDAHHGNAYPASVLLEE